MNKKIIILFGFLLALLVVVFYLDQRVQKIEKALLNITFLDVGQGDAILIETPNEYQVLIDGGRGEQVLKSLSKEMKFNDREIDLLIATHGDADHIGGFINIFERYDVKNYADYGLNEDTDLLNELESKIQNENLISRLVLRSGQRIILDEKNNIYLDVLWPPENFSTEDRNNSSVVLELIYGESEFLLTGDAGSFVENLLIQNYETQIKTDYLKAGHHGSKTSTSQNFLEKVNPNTVIISAGKNNSYGHPSKEVIDLLQKNNIQYFETSKNGNIKIQSDGKSEEIFIEFTNLEQKNLTQGQALSVTERREILNYFSFFKSFVDTVFIHSF